MRRRLCKSVFVMAFLACSIPVTVSASGSPTKLMASILTAGRAQHSVHYVGSATRGAVRVKQVADVGISQGIQRITYSRGAKIGHATVIVSANTAYVRGDAFIFVNYMGYKPVAAKKYAGAWIRIPHGDPDYSVVAEAVTLPSTIEEFRLTRSLSIVPSTTIAGQRVIGVKGKGPGQSLFTTLYARATGLPLPVESKTRYGKAIFSKWNEPIAVAVPMSAVPISKTGLE